MKHVLTTAAGGVVALLVLTSHWFARQAHHAHLTHGQEAGIAAVIVVTVDLVLIAVFRISKPKPPVIPPQRPRYTSARF